MTELERRKSRLSCDQLKNELTQAVREMLIDSNNRGVIEDELAYHRETPHVWTHRTEHHLRLTRLISEIDKEDGRRQRMFELIHKGNP